MKDEKIVLKKIKKGGHHGDHGGSWKVAYADFVTAMMALFLCLWLINMIAPEKRARVAHYFKHFSIFDKSGTSIMEKSSKIFNETGESRKTPLSESEGMLSEDYEKKQLSKEKSYYIQKTLNKGESSTKAEEIRELIRTAIEAKLGDVGDQVLIEVFEGGVRIQLVDKEGRPMFELGSSKPTPLAINILEIIADNIESLPYPVAIEGHTDSLPYKSTMYSNWDLSTERALTTKRLLESFDLSSDRIAKIAGYADTMPLIRENPRDPRNRRISLLLLLPKEQNDGEDGIQRTRNEPSYDISEIRF
ncbi:MAG: flagellar motor protein MotB [Thermoproteota archaeon]